MTSIFGKQEYLRRIHCVQDYIEAHLADSLTLEELAIVAGFSKYHFHRIFKGIVHESLLHYVNRIKLERAAGALVHRPELTVTDIAYHFGFTDSAVFSRTFKDYFRVTPSAYRRQNSKICKDEDRFPAYNGYDTAVERANSTRNVRGDVEIVNLEATPVMYVRYIGSYSGLEVAFPGMIEKLLGFAFQQQLFDPENTRLLSIFHDNHEFTKPDQLRTSLCLSLPNNAMWEEHSEFGRMTIPAGKYAVGHFEIFQEEYGAAWDYMYGEWLTNSSQQPRDSFPFELYRTNPDDDSTGKQCVDIYIPVTPLGII